MSDDVFESPGQDQSDALSAPRPPAQATPSPTGYRDYQPPAEALRLYNADSPAHSPAVSTAAASASTPRDAHDLGEQPVHKTILLGDSGVGKTSLLVQFDTGRFQSGSFSATVGIGFTLSAGDSGPDVSRGVDHGCS